MTEWNIIITKCMQTYMYMYSIINYVCIILISTYGQLNVHLYIIMCKYIPRPSETCIYMYLDIFAHFLLFSL